MKAQEFLERMQFYCRELKKNGVENVPTSAIEDWVSELEQESKETPWDVTRLFVLQEEYRKKADAQKDVIAAGDQALKALLAVNGGAAVALLAFFGAIAKSGASIPAAGAIGDALGAFLFGVFAAAFAYGVRFVSQAGFDDQFKRKSQEIGGGARALAILLAFVSLASFGAGGLTAVNGLGSISDSAPTSSIPAIGGPPSTISHELPGPRPQVIANQPVKP